MHPARWLVIPAVLAALAFSGGCKSDSDKKPRSRVAKGVATVIDLPNNRVAMRVRLESSGGESEIHGTVTPETEVFINGVRSAVGDVRVGDELEVEYQRSGEGASVKYVVSRVEVARPQNWKSLAPATQDAATAAPVAKAPPSPAPGLTTAGAAPHAHDHGEANTVIKPTASADAPAKVEQRDQLTRQIYDSIRQRMDEALAKRAELLGGGAAPGAPEVLEQEKVIRRARDLLIEVGENVEPVVPPLFDGAAAPAATTQPAAAG